MRRPTTIGAARAVRHRVWTWLAWGVAAPVLLAGALWMFRLTVAEWTVAWLAASNGLGPAEITIEEINLDRLAASDIRLGRDGSIGLRRIVAEYSPMQLMRGRIGKIVLVGLRASGRLDGDRLVVAGAELPLSSPGRPRLPSLPASSIRVEDASLSLDTPRGRITLAVTGTLDQGEDGIFFAGEAELRHARVRARASFSGTARMEGNSVALRLVSRHRAEFDRLSGSGEAVIEIAAAEHSSQVTFELSDTALRQPGIDATGITGRGSLRMRGDAVEAADATFRVTHLRSGGLGGAVPRVALRYDGQEVSAQARLRGALGEVELTAKGSARDAARPVSLVLKGFVRAAALAPLAPVPVRAKGRLAFDLTGELRAPAEAIAALPGNWERAARLVTMTGTAGFDLAEIDIENRVSAGAVTASANLAVADNTLRIRSITGLTATDVRLGPAWSDALPQAVRSQLDGRPISVSIGGEDGSRLATEIRALADGWDVRAITGLRARAGRVRLDAELDSRFALDREFALRAATLAYLSLALKGIRYRGMAGEFELLLSEASGSATNAAGRLAVTASARGSLAGTEARAKLALDVDGVLALADGGVKFIPAPGSKAVVSRLDVSGRVRLSAPLTVGFGGGKNRISVDSSGNVGYRLRLAPIDAALELAGRGAIRVRLPSVLATGGGGASRFVIADGEVTAGFAALAAEGIAGRLGWGPGSKGEARLTIARARHTGVPALIAPLALEIEASLDGDKANFSIRSPAPVISIVGRHDLSRARGTADLRLGPIRFAPGGLQPGALSPRLAGIVEDAEGVLGATGKIAWDAGGLDPRLTVELDRLGFGIGVGRISDIEGRVLVDSLTPPGTARGQRVTASVVIGALPAMPLTARFQMRRDGKLAIETASLDFAGGTLSTANVIADFARRAADFTVTVAGVSVERLLALLKIPELSGTGKLAGGIDLRVEAGRLVSAKGTLTGAGKGVLRLSDPAVLATLARREDTVGLAMKALANFRYDSLSIDIDVGEDASGAVKLRLTGANPEVLDGYPFAFNINLETDFGRLARLLMGGVGAAEAFIGTTLGGALK